ncbi:winged helix-turn-helix transcriptional regulator [Nocardia fusca]|uniref:winged helix-turn-helix transcriptional regulator n=1 Tax=Nocardia fusca TaxID=941183 RepID=UPI0037C5B6E6
MAKTYGDQCAAARALDLVGERWSLMIVRELLYGPKRFSELHHGLPNASSAALSQRLRDLEAGGVVRRRKLGSPTNAQVYQLTDWGHELQPLLVLLGRWGRRAPLTPDARPVGTDSLMLALQSHRRSPIAGNDATVAVFIDDDAFTLRVTAGELTIDRGEPHNADATLTADSATLLELIIHERPLDELADRTRIDGDRTILTRIFDHSTWTTP